MYREKLKEELKTLKKKLSAEDKPIAIQLPEGLKQHSTLILDELKEYDPILFTDPSYGACDLRDEDAKKYGCNLLIHFGHATMGKPRIKTLFIPISYKFNEEEFNYVIDEIKKLGKDKINLVTTINFLEEVPRITKELANNKISVMNAKETEHIKKNHVLGCDSSTITQTNELIVYMGDGNFHPNNLGFVFEKTNIHLVNPIQRTTKKLEINDLFIKQRYALIAKAKNCKTFGILVSSKLGQFRLRFAKHIKEKLEKTGKKAYILASDYINESYLEGIQVDCYVNTACPRIAYDDHMNFNKPIITPQEVDLLEDTTKELKIDQIREIEEFYN
jgi:2-(3-amino-3-carboxypropyl)histidine synthase